MAEPPPHAGAHAASHHSSHRARRTWSRWLFILIVVLVAAELFLRFYVGLGNPPLVITDPEIDYLFAPSQDCRRFGHRFATNAWSMRSDDFPKGKSSADEFRVMLIGDSVINGGSQTDQSELASEILQRSLAARLNRTVVVGNISAASWGPGNMLAYTRRFGFFEADVVVIVVSSDDSWDVPEFAPLGVDAPTRRPFLALEELLVRYAPRALPAFLKPERPGGRPARPTAELIKQATGDLAALIGSARESNARVIVAYQPKLHEVNAAKDAGQEALEPTARVAGATYLDMTPAYLAHSPVQSLFRDDEHPNAAGQRLIAEWLLEPLSAAASGPTASPP